MWCGWIDHSVGRGRHWSLNTYVLFDPGNNRNVWQGSSLCVGVRVGVRGLKWGRGGGSTYRRVMYMIRKRDPPPPLSPPAPTRTLLSCIFSGYMTTWWAMVIDRDLYEDGDVLLISGHGSIIPSFPDQPVTVDRWVYLRNHGLSPKYPYLPGSRHL